MERKRALRRFARTFGRSIAPTLLLCCMSSQPGLAQSDGRTFEQTVTDIPDPIAPPTAGGEAEARPLGEGMASYYADRFHGRRTASGEAFDKFALTAAHPTLPFGSMVRVTNPRNGQQVVVRINDRGPFSGGRVIDLSRAAAEQLDIVRTGHALVELALLEGVPVRPTASLLEGVPPAS